MDVKLRIQLRSGKFKNNKILRSKFSKEEQDIHGKS